MRAVVLDLEGLETFDLSSVRTQLDELVVYNLTSPEQVVERIKGFDIVITNKTPITAATIQASPVLKYICVLATGTNVVDKTAAEEAGVPVSNCVAYGVDSVVQHVWALMLALHTNLPAYDRDIRQGAWQQSQQFCFFNHPIIEMKGRTLGIIGYGNLGQGVARIAEAFGMNLLICQRPGSELCAGRVSFEALLEQADIITLHCPLTPETDNLFHADTFRKMKKSAFLINTARGGIVNESDLAQALFQGEIAGAATDVLTVEPPRQGNPLLDSSIPNLIVTPHIAWGSELARQRIIQQTAENLKAFLDGQPVRTV